MKASEILIRGKSLIADPINWTQGTVARDESGRETLVENAEAVRFCSIGALFKAAHEIDPFNFLMNPISDAGLDCLEATAEAMGERVAQYNDNHTHAEVMAFWDKAIELAKLGEQK